MEQTNRMEQEEMREDAPLNAPLLAQELAEDREAMRAEEQAEDAQALEADIREGIGMLFEDGWTAEELGALSQDEGVRADVAAGMDLIRAAAKMLRRQLHAAPRRRGLPVSRASSAGQASAGNPIEEMTDAQFEAFSRQAKAAAMMGKRVKM